MLRFCTLPVSLMLNYDRTVGVREQKRLEAAFVLGGNQPLLYLALKNSNDNPTHTLKSHPPTPNTAMEHG